jgi:aminoglycoside phosphotransferase
LKSPLQLPAEVRSVAESALGTKRFRSEFAWLSWAGTVWRVAGESGAVYVKRASDLAGERDRIVWLTGRLPVPELVGFIHVKDDDWLLTRELPGVHLYHASLAWEPARIARRFGEILREIHSIDAAGCPFGYPAPGNVFIHGDFCLPNVLVEQGALVGLVDVGRAGLGDPRDDLAAGVWTLHYNFGHGFARDFLDAYGATVPVSDKEIEKLRRRYGRPRPHRPRRGVAVLPGERGGEPSA